MARNFRQKRCEAKVSATSTFNTMFIAFKNEFF